MSKAFEINQAAIRQMMGEIQREMDKTPVRVPIHADAASAAPTTTPVTVNNYHAPFVTVVGDRAQIAWGNADVAQEQSRVEQVAPGYEDLARVLAGLLGDMSIYQISHEDEADARQNAVVVLAEIVKPQPDRSLIRRALTMLKGILAPIATAVLTAGATTASTQAAQEAIKVIEHAMGS